MPIGAITMVLANVGLQIYNNWCGSRQNSKLQRKREEFERAARERNTEHMWKLLREGQELTVQLEKEKHDDRLKELKEEVNHLLERLTYEATISNWPLKVLPIVMKNQAFGNLLANQEEHIAMHVIFTRSNYDKFNKFVYPVIEKELEQYCDKHWSTVTDHPVLFYSGAWKPLANPTDVQVSAMREELKNLPTFLITPFFRPDDGTLVFQLHMWGVGANSTDQFDVPEIEPKSDEFHFQHLYTDKDDYENTKDVLAWIVEDLVPYLECMIGYMADTYFWSSSGLAPHLPLLVTNGIINTDGMKYLISDSREYYDKMLLESSRGEVVFSQENLLNLLAESARLWDKEDVKRVMLENTFLAMCSSSLNMKIYSWDDLKALISIENAEDSDFYDYVILKDLSLVKKLGHRINVKSQRIEKLYDSLSKISKEQFEIIDSHNFNIKKLLRFAESRKEQVVGPKYFAYIIWNKNIVIGTYVSDECKPCAYLKGHTTRFFIIRYEVCEQAGASRFRVCNPVSKEMEYNLEDNWDRSYYIIDITDKKLIKMKEKTFEEKFGHSFERIGRGLGKILDGITNPIENPTSDQLWGDGQSHTPGQTDTLRQLLSYFITNAGRTIPAERVENMSMRKILDWVDKNVPAFADKVYLIKGVNEEYGKHVICAFFASGDKVMLQEDSPRICFITTEYNEEMRQAFNEKDVCLIPLK